MEEEKYDELRDLFAEEGEVEIGKHRFPVRHLQVRHAGLMQKAFDVAWAMLGDDAESAKILAERAEDILPAISAATDIPLVALRKMRGGVQLRLWAAVLKVNDDFFVQVPDHMFGETAARVVKMIPAMATAGEPPSSTSEPTDTPNAKRIPLAALHSSTAARN